MLTSLLPRAAAVAAVLGLAVPALAQIGAQVPTDGTDRNDGREGYGRQGAEARQDRARDRAELQRRGDALGTAADPDAAALQNRTAPNARPGANAAAPGNAAAVPAAALAQWIAQDNDAEIALATFAAGKTENDRVKRFAEAMRQAHTDFGAKLEPLTGGPLSGAADPRVTDRAPAPNARNAAAADRFGDDLTQSDVDDIDAAVEGDLDAPGLVDDPPVASRTAPGAGLLAGDDADNDEPTTAVPGADVNADRFAARPVAPVAGAATAADVLAFRADLKKQCGQSLKGAFDELAPSDFDKAYASQQIGAHLSMIDTLKLAERQATNAGDDRAATVFAEGVDVTNRHLMMAIALLNEVTPQPVETRN